MSNECSSAAAYQYGGECLPNTGFPAGDMILVAIFCIALGVFIWAALRMAAD